MMQRLPQRLLGKRVALAALCASLAHCADVDTSGSTDGLPGDSGDQTTDTGSNGTASVATGNTKFVFGKHDVTASVPSFVKVPQGADISQVQHWFIELEGVPMAQGGDRDALDEAVEAFRESAYGATLAYRERIRFDGIVHGISVQMKHTELGKLGTVKGIKAVYPVGQTQMPKLKPVQVQPAMFSAVKMTGADVVQNTLGFDGTGIRVGIIDSGIDVDHPDFHVGGTLAGASRIDLTKSYDFVGDDYNSGDPANDTPAPDDNPDDCGGHGTHVAGIVGASGNPATGGVVGVAPGVTFQAYRVFGCDGSTGDDVISAAIERAFTDGADVINLSLGSDNGWGTGFFSLALSRALDLGIVAVAAAGNNGSNGPWTVGSPGAGENVVTVGSIDNAKALFAKATYNGADIPYATLTGAPATPTTGTFGPIVYVGRGCPADATAGTPEDAYLGDPNGKVALIDRGVCFFADKYARAKAAGAIGVIIAQNRNESPFAGSLGDGTHDIPGIMVGQADGVTLRAGGELTWTDEKLELDTPTGGLLSGFSSWGPTPELLLKPDVSAPGGAIYSTWPLSRDDGEDPGHAVLSGTSMATPHVAGAVALLLEAKPDLPASRVNTLLQNNALPVAYSATLRQYLSPVHAQGAGMIHIDAAIQAKTVVTPSKVFAGEGENGTFEVPLYVENQSNAEATYTVAVKENALATFGDSLTGGADLFLGAGTVEFVVVAPGGSTQVTNTVTVPARSARTIGVRITAPGADELPDGAVYGGYITLTPQDGAQATAVTVPYAGIAGDYQAIDPVVATPVPGVDQAVVLLNDSTLIEDRLHEYDPSEVAEAGHVYSMKDGDVPTGIMQFSHAAAKWTAELVPHGSNAWLGAIPAFEYTQMPRNNATGSLSYWSFSTSELGAGRLPDGTYHVRMKILKALGNPGVADHVITLESVPFVIDRTAEPPPATP